MCGYLTIFMKYIWTSRVEEVIEICVKQYLNEIASNWPEKLGNNNEYNKGIVSVIFIHKTFECIPTRKSCQVLIQTLIY